MTDVTNFLYNTDHPQDKVIYLNSGSFTIPTPTAGFYHTIPHGLPFTPLVGGGWSTASDFSVTYDFGSGTAPSTSPSTANFNIELDIAADATNIYIIPGNITGSTQLVYFRIFGLEPSDSTATLIGTAASADTFAFNTDYNYTKVYSAGELTGLSASSTSTVTHNLGIVPQVASWATSSAKLFVASVFLADVTYPIFRTDFIGTLDDVSVVASTTTVDFKTGSGSGVSRIDYRIYYDESGVAP